jgi:hypothetical protein
MGDVAFAYQGEPARPYLTLTLVGPNGCSLDVQGLLDTGADVTGLAVEDAIRLGYTADNLAEGAIVVFNGTEVPGFEAQVPVRAMIHGEYPGAPVFEVYPRFMRRDRALWGRDLLESLSAVAFDEQARTFRLEWDEPAESEAA